MFKQDDDDTQAIPPVAHAHKTHFASTSGQFLQQCEGRLLTTIPSGGHFKDIGPSGKKNWTSELLREHELGVLHAEHSCSPNDFQKARWPKAI